MKILDNIINSCDVYESNGIYYYIYNEERIRKKKMSSILKVDKTKYNIEDLDYKKDLYVAEYNPDKMYVLFADKFIDIYNFKNTDKIDRQMVSEYFKSNSKYYTESVQLTIIGNRELIGLIQEFI